MIWGGGWGKREIHHLPGQPVPVFHYPHSKKFLLYIQSKSALPYFKAIAPCPIATGPCEEIFPFFPIGPLQILKGCYNVSLQPSFLEDKQPQLSQPFLIGEMLQPSGYLCGPPLCTLHQLCFLLVLGYFQMKTILQNRVVSHLLFIGPE